MINCTANIICLVVDCKVNKELIAIRDNRVYPIVSTCKLNKR